jgi:hypothetical protein
MPRVSKTKAAVRTAVKEAKTATKTGAADKETFSGASGTVRERWGKERVVEKHGKGSYPNMVCDSCKAADLIIIRDYHPIVLCCRVCTTVFEVY